MAQDDPPPGGHSGQVDGDSPLPPSVSFDQTLEWARQFVQGNSPEAATEGESLDDSHL